MIQDDLLKILRCPETRQPLRVAEGELLSRLNEEIRGGRLENRVGQKVENVLDGGLIREDGQYLYPIVDDIPIMLSDESIRLKDFS